MLCLLGVGDARKNRVIKAAMKELAEYEEKHGIKCKADWAKHHPIFKTEDWLKLDPTKHSILKHPGEAEKAIAVI